MRIKQMLRRWGWESEGSNSRSSVELGLSGWLAKTPSGLLFFFLSKLSWAYISILTIKMPNKYKVCLHQRKLVHRKANIYQTNSREGGNKGSREADKHNPPVSHSWCVKSTLAPLHKELYSSIDPKISHWSYFCTSIGTAQYPWPVSLLSARQYT